MKTVLWELNATKTMIYLLTMNILFWRVVNIMAVLSLSIPKFTAGQTSSPISTATGLSTSTPRTNPPKRQPQFDERGAVAVTNTGPLVVPNTPPSAPPKSPKKPKFSKIPTGKNPPPPPLPPPAIAPTPAPPTAGIVRNLIVEEVLQRNDQIYTRVFGDLGEIRGTFRIVPESGADLVRQMPQGSNPYMLLPEEFRVGDSYGDLERPLDLLRYKTDQFWNLLTYKGQYESEVLNSNQPGAPGQILPFEYVRVDTDLDTLQYEIPVSINGTIAVDTPTNNPFGVYYKELIELSANPSVFGNMQNVSPCSELIPDVSGIIRPETLDYTGRTLLPISESSKFTSGFLTPERLSSVIPGKASSNRVADNTKKRINRWLTDLFGSD
jgi:hypothetical protein